MPVPTEAGVARDYSASKVDSENGMLNVDFDGVEIHKAIRMLANAAHQNFVIHSGVQTDTVSMKLTGVTFEIALNKLLGAVKQPITYKYDTSVYTIGP
jgi:type II secretory pathway component GspD/PulD (secretin)